MNTAINLEELKTAWRVAKAAEDAANAERLRVEAAIVALMPSKLDGSVTDAGVTVTYKVTRKVDAIERAVRLNAPVAKATRAEINLDLLSLLQRLPRQ